MNNITTIAALPIGEFDSDPVRSEFEAIIKAFDRFEVDLVLADAVSDEEEARHTVQNLSARHPDLLLLICLRGLSARAMEAAAQTSPMPCLIWPLQGRYALPSSTLARGALHESRCQVELIYGPPGHPPLAERIRCVMRASRAFTRLHRSRIGVIGGLFPNLTSCRYEPDVLKAKLGTDILPIPIEEVQDSLQHAASNVHEIEQLRNEITNAHSLSDRYEPCLEAGITLHLALRHIAETRHLRGFAAECWTGFPKHFGVNPCLGFLEDSYVLACEGDVMLCALLLIIQDLIGVNAYAGDLYDLDLDGMLTLVHCGAPASLASDPKDVVLSRSESAIERGVDTITCRPKMGMGPVTLLRLHGQDCDKMHLALGDLVSSEQSPDLMATVRIDGDRLEFLKHCYGNHYVVAPGDLREELRLLCDWLGITIYED